MRFKRILLVSLLYPTGINTLPAQPPAGLGYIAEALDGKFDYQVFDLSLGYKQEDLFKKIREYNPDLLGISMMTFNYCASYGLLNTIKDEFKGLNIIVGGPHISTFREKALKDCPAIDFGAVMEAEETIVDLCLGKDLTQIKGLLFRGEQGIEYTGDTFIQDLNKIAIPLYERFEMDRYLVKRMKIVTSRGCPYQCIYCPVETAIGRRLRARTPESVVNEIIYWHNKGFKEFDIVDDNFSFSKERVYKICELIEKNNLKITLNCPNGIRADTVDRELLVKMKETGFQMIAFGVEAGNNRMLKVLNKQENIEEIEEAIKVSCELGFDVVLFFLIGSPYETLADINDSIALAKRYPVYEARFYNLIPFPRTALFDWVKYNGYFLRQPEEYLNDVSHFENNPSFVTPELPLEERKKIFETTSRLSKTIKINTLKRKLSKYGFAGKIAAEIFMSERFRSIYQKSRFLRKSVELMKKGVS